MLNCAEIPGIAGDELSSCRRCYIARVLLGLWSFAPDTMLAEAEVKLDCKTPLY